MVSGKQFPYSIAISNVRSAHNVGAIFRSADGAGVRHIHLIGYTPTPAHPKVVKTSLGTETSVSWEHHENWEDFVGYAVASNQTLVGVETEDNAQDIFDYEFPQNCILVLGNEVEGLSSQEINSINTFVKIPMWGAKGSLSVYVAASIAMYVVSQKFNLKSNFIPVNLPFKL